MLNLKVFGIFLLLIAQSVFALDCDPLRPGNKYTNTIETEVKGSANTLFKIGEVGGDVKNKVVTEVEAIFENHPDANRTEIKNRLIYLYCTLLNDSEALSDDQKFNKLQDLSNSLFDIPDEKEAPKTSSRTYRIDKTKDNHPNLFPNSEEYMETFEADPGYKIINVKWNPASVNNADNIKHNISADRRSVTFSYKLTSGPSVDRWRGWIRGDIILDQEKL